MAKESNNPFRNVKSKLPTSRNTVKWIAVLVFTVLIVVLLFFLFTGKNEEQTDNKLTATPMQTPVLTPQEQPTDTPLPTKEPDTLDKTPTKEPTQKPENSSQETTPLPTQTVTVTPTPALNAAQAKEVVSAKVDTNQYQIQLVNASLQIGNGSYYQFGAIFEQEFLYPFLVVDKMSGILYCYDSMTETVFDFTTFPLQTVETPTPTPTKEPQTILTAKEAYQILCTYSKESLHIAKAVSEYDAEYDNELTLIDGKDCYRINLSEFSNGKTRNRGEFYISVDGTKCFYIDSDTNEFMEAVK